MNQNHARMKADAPMDLIDLIKRLAIEWRAILLFAALSGLLFYFVYQRQQAKQTPQAQTAQTEEDSEAENTSANLRAGLSDADYNAVMLAVRDTNLISERSKYLDQSIWVNQNVNGAPSIRYLLSIDSKNVTSASLRAYYKYFFESSEFVSAVSSIFGKAIPENDLREMIVLGIPNYSSLDIMGDPSVIEISILLTESIDKEALDQVVKEQVTACHDTLSASIGDHTAEIISSDLRIGYDFNAVTRKRDILYEIYNLKAQLKSTLGEFSSAQNILYSKLTDANAQEVEVVTPAATDGRAKKKFLLAGIAIAIFLYICAAVVLTLLTSRVHSQKEMSGIPCLGELRSYRATSFFDRLFRSRLLYRLFYRSSEAEKVVDLAKVMIKDSDVHSLTIVSAVSPAETDSVSGISSALSGAEIETKIVSLNQNEAILPSDLTGSKNLILLLEANYTKYRDVKELWSVCDLCGISVLGYILTGH